MTCNNQNHSWVVDPTNFTIKCKVCGTVQAKSTKVEEDEETKGDSTEEAYDRAMRGI